MPEFTDGPPLRKAHLAQELMWRNSAANELKDLAGKWLEEIRSSPKETPAADAVVLMNFTASAQTQWDFIVIAVDSARDNNELSHIAAGPLEHLLGWHGTSFIEEVEMRAARDPKFARMVSYAWKYRMSEEVWRRVQVIQARVK